MTEKFPKEETYGLTNQSRRAASSIAANITEGCCKNTKADFANFLNISPGSSNEAGYLLQLSKDSSYTAVEDYEILAKLVNEIKAMLIALIIKVRN